MTGVGAVTNTARVAPGSNVVVIGCGGVGLNAVQGAVLAGADRIIAVDLLDNKLEYAREFGATDVVNAGNGDAVARVVEMTGGGVDYAFEVIGNPRTIEQAYGMCRPGGTVVVVGMAPETDTFEVNALSLPRTERALLGSWYGSARPWVDLPKLADLYMNGRLKIDEMISRTYRLEEINTAYDALAAGEVRAQRHRVRLTRRRDMREGRRRLPERSPLREGRNGRCCGTPERLLFRGTGGALFTNVHLAWSRSRRHAGDVFAAARGPLCGAELRPRQHGRGDRRVRGDEVHRSRALAKKKPVIRWPTLIPRPTARRSMPAPRSRTGSRT